jgi:asparagine synthase (glutamine-hydrolysing)
LSDVPIGLYLSGGLDSSAIAVALHGLGADVQAYTHGFNGHSFDEAPVALETAAYLGIPCREVSLADGTMVAAEVARQFDEPQGYGALMAYMSLCRSTTGRKVVLAGDGGDELLGGYSWYNNLGGGPRRHGLMRLFGPGKPSASEVLMRHVQRQFPRFSPAEATRLLAPTGLSFDDDTLLAPLKRHWVGELPVRRALQRVDLGNFCVDSILTKVDRASMTHGIEVRVPFLDHRLVEAVLTRPVTEREAVENKPLLRDYLAGRVPSAVLRQPKLGFSLRSGLPAPAPTVLDRVAEGPLVSGGYLAPSWRELAAAETPDRNGRLFALYALDGWMREWSADCRYPRNAI